MRVKTVLGAAVIAAVAGAIGAGCASNSGGERAVNAAAGEREMLSYGLGFMIAEDMLAGLTADGVSPDLALVSAGFADAVAGTDPRFDAGAMRELLRQKKAEIDAANAQRLYDEDADFRALADENAAASGRYLAQQRAIAGTRVLDGGVLMRTITDGRGPAVEGAETVTVDFARFGMNGVQFDSGSGETVAIATLPAGTRTAAARMRVGGTYRVVVPPERAFGLAGQPPAIGPNEAVTFEVTVRAINEPVGGAS